MTGSHLEMPIVCFQLQKLLCPILLKRPEGGGGGRDHIRDWRVDIPPSLCANAPEACFASICLVMFPQQVILQVFVFARRKCFVCCCFPAHLKPKPDFPNMPACTSHKYLGPLAEWKCSSQPRSAAPVCRSGKRTPVVSNHSRQHVLPLPTSFTCPLLHQRHAGPFLGTHAGLGWGPCCPRPLLAGRRHAWTHQLRISFAFVGPVPGSTLLPTASKSHVSVR